MIDTAEEKLRSLFEQAPGFMAFLRGPRHVFTFANAAYLRLVGNRTIIGEPVREAFPEICKQGYFDRLDEAYRTGEPFVARNARVFFQNVEGAPPEETFLDFVYQPFRDRDGVISGIFVEGSDVTERKRTADAMRASQIETERQRRLYEAILSNTPDLAYVFGLDHRFIYANEALLKMWGRTREEAIGGNLLELGYEPWHAAMHDREIEQVIATGKPIRGVVPFTGTFGHRIYDYIFVPVFGLGGRIEAVAGTTRDITERDRSEQALRESGSRLRRLNEDLESRVREEVAARVAVQARLAHTQRMEALGQLAGGIAHDFNNIIQAILGGAAMIERRPGDPERVRELASLVAEAAERGGAITRRLLTFSRRADLRAEPMDVASLLADIQEILSHTLGAGITIRIEAEPDLPSLLADKTQLETALVNLATNARDAMQGTGTLTFTAAAEIVEDGAAASRPAGLKPGAYVRLEAADTGSGMVPEVLAHASEPFFTTKGTGRGTGLGLAMARGFAKQSGGGFAIASLPGHGATVTLWLPIAAGPLRADVPGEEEPGSAASANARARLLLVDDDTLVRGMLARELEAEGYAVLSAASGAEALAVLDAGEEIDVLVSDLSMPNMDGMHTIREAKRRRPRLPAILLTGFVAETAGVALEEAPGGTVTVLRKPVRGRVLAERIAALLGGVAAEGRKDGVKVAR